MTKQTKKCQAHYSCVEHNIMYKTQFSMRKRNDSPTYKPEAKRRLREAQGQQKDEALIKEGGEDYYAFFMLMWILDQEMQITVVMILMLYNETFNQMRITRKTIKARKSNKDTYEPSGEDEENSGQERDKAKQLRRDVTKRIKYEHQDDENMPQVTLYNPGM